MIIFLYGADAYRSKQKLDEIVSQYKSVRKSGLNLKYLDASESDFSDFYNHFKVASMFAETKLVIVKNLFENKKFQEAFLAELKNLESLKDVILLYEKEEPDQRLKIFKTLTKECKCQEFKLLEGASLRTWVQNEFGAQKINQDALALLVQYVGNDLWKLSGEIKKLSNFKSGAVIKKEDVVLLVKPGIENDIFKTIDALAAQDKKTALALLRQHLDNGDAPLYLLSMIAFQFKNLLIVKELASQGLMYNSIVKKSGLHPFVVKKNYYQCSQFSLEKLKEMYRQIFECDLNIKTGKIESETALDLLVAKL
jgi:DNA polymerase-3 subunit delta